MKTKPVNESKSRKQNTASIVAAMYVIPLGGTGWMVKESQTKKFTAITSSKREALQIARSFAKRKGWMIVVFAKDGSIKQQISYAD